MNEQDNKRNMMYGNNQAVTHLNKVPGFDPLQFLRPAISEKNTGKTDEAGSALSKALVPPCSSPWTHEADRIEDYRPDGNF